MLIQLYNWFQRQLFPGASAGPPARRQQFLSVIAAGTVALLLAAGLSELLRPSLGSESQRLRLGTLYLSQAVLVAAIWVWNWRGHTVSAGYAYLLVTIAAITLAISASGNSDSAVAYAVPIMVASFILSPPASFLAAALAITANLASAIAVGDGSGPRLAPLAALAAIAVVAWVLAARLERALQVAQAAQTQYQSLVERLPAFVYLTEFGRDGQWLYASPQIEALLGFTPAEWLADPDIWHRQLHPDDGERVAAQVAHSRSTGEPLRVDYRMANRQGRYLWVRDDAAVIRLGGQRDRLQGVILDISEGVAAEAALRESETRYRTLFELAGEAFLMVRPGNGEIMDANLAALRLLGYERADLLRLSPMDLVAPDMRESTRREGEVQLARQGFFSLETQWLRRDGATIPVLVSGRPVPLTGEAQLQLIARDMTDQRAAEGKLRASLHEKEVLLREIHHRVKNNLQIISSLIDLQADHVRDPQALALFRDGQDRIRSMALVHEELYQSEDLARIDFGTYLERLATGLFQAYSAQPSIALRLAVEPVRLTVDLAIPCGLIVNEIVANSLKYAFPDGRSGGVSIELQAEGDQLRLRVGDDGVGLPAGLDFRQTETLGLQLVNILTRQVKGQVELDRRHGTVFTLTFSRQARKSSHDA